MKTPYKFLFSVVIPAVMVVSCNSPESSEEEEIEFITDTLRTEIAEPIKTLIVSGKVKEVTPGKDGYTAQILTSDNEVYFLTVSVPNLRDPKQYKTIKTGESVKVSGESWKLEMDNYITVREML